MAFGFLNLASSSYTYAGSLSIEVDQCYNAQGDDDNTELITSCNPTPAPTPIPTNPTPKPTPEPTSPTVKPSSLSPTPTPTPRPTAPSPRPSPRPSYRPNAAPTAYPTEAIRFQIAFNVTQVSLATYHMVLMLVLKTIVSLIHQKIHFITVAEFQSEYALNCEVLRLTIAYVCGQLVHTNNINITIPAQVSTAYTTDLTTVLYSVSLVLGEQNDFTSTEAAYQTLSALLRQSVETGIFTEELQFYASIMDSLYLLDATVYDEPKISPPTSEYLSAFSSPPSTAPISPRSKVPTTPPTAAPSASSNGGGGSSGGGGDKNTYFYLWIVFMVSQLLFCVIFVFFVYCPQWVQAKLNRCSHSCRTFGDYFTTLRRTPLV